MSSKFDTSAPDNEVLEAARRRQADIEALALEFPLGSLCHPRCNEWVCMMVQQCKWEGATNRAAVEVVWFDRHHRLHMDTFVPELLVKAVART